MAEAAPAFDVGKLIADVRKGGEPVERAYRLLFDTELGRLVLAHHLAECGVGRRYGSEATAAQLRYSTGMQDAALELARMAGFDHVDHAVAVMTDHSEGTTDDAAFNHQPDLPVYVPGPGEEF